MKWGSFNQQVSFALQESKKNQSKERIIHIKWKSIQLYLPVNLHSLLDEALVGEAAVDINTYFLTEAQQTVKNISKVVVQQIQKQASKILKMITQD